MLKKTFFQIHWFLGITAGLILSLMGVTGAIYSYDQQILKWLNQDSYVVEVAQTPKLKKRKIFSSDDSVKKVIYLATSNAAKKWTMPIQNWRLAMNWFTIHFDDRLKDHL